MNMREIFLFFWEDQPLRFFDVGSKTVTKKLT